MEWALARTHGDVRQTVSGTVWVDSVQLGASRIDSTQNQSCTDITLVTKNRITGFYLPLVSFSDSPERTGRDTAWACALQCRRVACDQCWASGARCWRKPWASSSRCRQQYPLRNNCNKNSHLSESVTLRGSLSVVTRCWERCSGSLNSFCRRRSVLPLLEYQLPTPLHPRKNKQSRQLLETFNSCFFIGTL